MKKRIIIKNYDPNFQQDHEFPEDEARLRKIFAMRGYELSLNDAEQLWCIRSNDYDAGWLLMGEDDEVVWEETLEFWRPEEQGLA